MDTRRAGDVSVIIAPEYLEPRVDMLNTRAAFLEPLELFRHT